VQLPTLVIPRACGVSSTLRPLESTPLSLEYRSPAGARHRASQRRDPVAGDDDREFGASSTNCNETAEKTHPHILAAPCARVVPEPLPLKQRAQGKPDARRTRSLACEMNKAHEQVTTGLPSLPGLPCAMVLTVSFVISPVTGLSCHRHQRNYFHQLDASVGASGPHDFAVRVSTFRQARHPRPPHLLPNDRDDRDTPLSGSRRAAEATDLRLREAEYFFRRGWTGRNRLIAFRKLGWARRP
jgi:hypothetical protein